MLSTKRPLVHRALERAGLLHIAARVLGGEALGDDDFAQLRTADLLAVAALADLVREQAQGDEVALVDLGVGSEGLPANVVWARPGLGATDGATGLDILREVALVRLATPAARPVAVSFDALGDKLAQAALTFGASVLVGTMTRRARARSESSTQVRVALPVAEDAATRTKKAELLGRVERAGRRARWGVSP